MSIVTFAPATRLGSHIIVTAYGVSGCGKTLSLLLLGRGLAGPNGKLGMIDTETGRGRIYANRVPGGYLYGELTPPFTPERYIEAIDDAERAGVEVLIIDQASSEWEGIGGILEMAETGKSRSGKMLEGLVKWARPKAAHKRYVQRLINSHMHLLIGLRAKEKMKQYTALDNPLPRGIEVGDIISEGFTPIQDKRFIFETTVQLFLPLGRRADLGKPIVEKCPEDLWAAFPEDQQISEKTGELIREWVAGGEPVDKELLTLRREAEEGAGSGVEAFRAYWRKLGKLNQNRLTDRLDNLRSIAESADADRSSPAVPLGGDSTLIAEHSGSSPAPLDTGEGPGEAVSTYNLVDADGVEHSYDDPESAFEAMRTLLLAGRDARGRDGLNAAWADMQPAVAALRDSGRPHLAEEIDAYYDQLLRPLPVRPAQKPAGEPPAPQMLAPAEIEQHHPTNAAVAETIDLPGTAPQSRRTQADWSQWRQQFDSHMRQCGTKDDLTKLIAANFDNIEDYSHAFPRAAGIFAAERTKRMEELPDG